MFKKILTAIITVATLFGFNTYSFAQNAVVVDFHPIPICDTGEAVGTIICLY